MADQGNYDEEALLDYSDDENIPDEHVVKNDDGSIIK